MATNRESAPQAAPEAPAEARHSKEDLMASKRFSKQRDLLAALLEDGQEYTAAEAETLAENYLGRKVA